ncbi:undecaprenyldiphospho-muramoylpentapeptide beta-N-acetylglucosaminyltransferase [Asticcacaulis biprosthecium C19]|uniref:UDP-N-acetylglucosamine--N-acetylmuramyl-(pentapeptide) pyrophosphoryl-undecaprenol N-acetylglucosamine transferase n=1 Tax=Asticcacaulis biprosthecium C19 TaxID=715226 RepID=F4QHE5_9CAUL|nr:undecaprenyldiphospho-muramoylpentapeptide beta-N-acetylglucosaminyltransferase [Asticcacaulis biprosthecium]EGF92682.1 undecaprenyldiphospho-muramoylpentapeptide beta-N-acetylglucosaminyltransferase [Asticcacaulis biprosthecium C19]
MAKAPKPRRKASSFSETPLAVVAAGGTGGHMFPAEALARELIARGWQVVLASDARGAAYADKFPAIERLSLEAATFKAGDPIGMARAAIKIALGTMQARKAFARLKPWAVIGFGGYPSYPALLAALGRKDVTLIHEQNSVLGRSNRQLVKKVDAVACAFPVLRMAPSELEGKVQVVGNPVRPDIQALYDEPYPAVEKTIRILVTGGSQGAKILSERVPQALASLPISIRINLQLEQQARAEQAEAAVKIYQDAEIHAEVSPFFSNMAERLERAHIVIGRSGASTVCELAVAGKPAILIPLKIAADDHQTHNAEVLKEAKAAVVIPEDEATVERLAEEIRTMIEGAALLPMRAKAAKSVARPDAAKLLADLVERTVAKVKQGAT